MNLKKSNSSLKTCSSLQIPFTTYNNSSAKDAIWSRELDDRIGDVDCSRSIIIGNYIAEITHVTNSIIRSSMSGLGGIEMRPRRHATIRVITKFMDMESMVAGSQSRNLSLDLDRSFGL